MSGMYGPTLFVDDDDLEIDDDDVARYQGSLFTGVSYQEGPGGVRCELPYAEGLLDGVARDIDLTTGRTVSESRYWRGMRHGLQRLLDLDGAVREESVFEVDIELRHELRDADSRIVERRALDPASPQWRFLQLRRDAFGADAPAV